MNTEGMVLSRLLGSSVALFVTGMTLAVGLVACGAPASDTSDGAGGTPGVGSGGAGNGSNVSGAPSAAGASQGVAGGSSNSAGADAGGAPGAAGATSNTGGAVGAAGASSAMCTGVTPWTAGTMASEVSHNGKRYLCKPGVAGWCSSPAAAYEPGVGFAWQDAWSDEGSCGSGGGGGGATGAGGSTGTAGSTSSGGATSAGCVLDSLLGESKFNAWFPNRNAFYTYANLCKAITKYPTFATSGDVTAQKREVAGFFANVARETGMLMYIDQINKDPSNGNYWGRGPLQLTWNYNYDACGKAIGQPLLATPTLVSTDGSITWQTGLWFWMTNDGGTGKTPHTAIVNGNFGGTIDAINGGLECKGDNEGADERIAHYKAFTQSLGVDPGTMLTCW